MAYVDNVAKNINVVKYLLVLQDLYGITGDPERMKTKVFNETVRAFSTMITKIETFEKNWVEKATELAQEMKKLCKQ